MALNSTSSIKSNTLHATPPLISGISDLHLSLISPIAVHWLTSAFFEILERSGWLAQYRLHTPAEELRRNRVTRRECLRVTLQCQVLQTLLGLALGSFGEEDVRGSEEYELAIWIGRVREIMRLLPALLGLTGIDFKSTASALSRLGGLLPAVSSIDVVIGKFFYWYLVPFSQIVLALIVADASMYCLHRLGHTNQWIYKHIHSQHHRLYVPYSWGGSYNHPFDSLVVDGLSYGLGCWVVGLSTRLSIILFCYATLKNVTDHCGYVFPWNPIKSITGTDASFHDVHNQSWGLKTNFGAHLSIWDRMMGTYFVEETKIFRLRERNRCSSGDLKSST